MHFSFLEKCDTMERKKEKMEKLEMARKKRNPQAVALAQQIISQYQPESVADMEDALKDIFGPMFEAMLQGEMNNHLGYESNDHGAKSTANRRNGYGTKTIKTTLSYR